MTLPRYETLFDRIAPGKSPHTFWLILFLAVCAMTLWLATLLEDPSERMTFRVMCTFIAAGFMAVPLVLNLSYDMLLRWAPQLDVFIERQSDEKVSLWFAHRLVLIRGTPAVTFSALTLGLLGVATFHNTDLFDYAHEGVELFARFVVFFSGAFAGIGLHMVVLATSIFWELGSLPDIRVRVQHHPFGILSVGTTLFRIWFLIAAVWSIYVASVVFSTGLDIYSLVLTPPIWLLAGPTIPLIVGTFVVAQVPLHRKIVAYKRVELDRIDRILESFRPHSLNEITEETRSNIEFVMQQREFYSTLPNWPCNLRTLAGAGISALTAISPMCFELASTMFSL